MVFCAGVFELHAYLIKVDLVFGIVNLGGVDQFTLSTPYPVFFLSFLDKEIKEIANYLLAYL